MRVKVLKYNDELKKCQDNNVKVDDDNDDNVKVDDDNGNNVKVDDDDEGNNLDGASASHCDVLNKPASVRSLKLSYFGTEWYLLAWETNWQFQSCWHGFKSGRQEERCLSRI